MTGADRKTASLAEFLARLSEAEAAEARAAAARIDALEREIGPPGWIERNLVPLVAVSAVMFALGLVGFFAGLAGWIGLGGVVLLLSAFPLLMFLYLLSVRGRTRLDDAKMALNEKHFLPHGGVYFGAAQGGGSVLLVERPKDAEPDLRAKVHAQYEAATKRRW